MPTIEFGYRYCVAVLIMATTTMAYFGRMNLSTAIVAMVKKKNVTHETYFGEVADGAPTYDWDEKSQGVILGSFFYGYFALQLVTGRLAEIVGPRRLCTTGLVMTGVLNLLTPWLANYYGWLIASRIIMGSFQAGIYPCAFAMAARWIPDHERSTVTSMSYIGGNLGTIIASSLAGYLCKYGFAGGWPSVFYVTGIVALIISVIYYFFITDYPENHWLVKEDEVQYIKSTIDRSHETRQRPPVPWMALIKSPVVWVGTFSQFSMMWALTVMMAKLPDYMFNVMKIPLEKTGYFDSAAYFSESFSLFCGGLLADYLIKRTNRPKTQIRKSFQAIASLGSGLCLFIIPYLHSDVNAFLAVLIISMLIIGLQSGGIVPLPSDLTNEFTATVFGFFNMIAMINGFICPLIVGAILDANPSNAHGQWAIVWYLTATIRIAGGLGFIMWGSAERQQWDSTHLENQHIISE